MGDLKRSSDVVYRAGLVSPVTGRGTQMAGFLSPVPLSRECRAIENLSNKILRYLFFITFREGIPTSSREAMFKRPFIRFSVLKEFLQQQEGAKYCYPRNSVDRFIENVSRMLQEVGVAVGGRQLSAAVE